MHVGACQEAVGLAAARDGVDLVLRQHDWLTQGGHLGLPAAAADARNALERIYLALGGDLTVLASARTTALQNDFFHAPTGTMVEVDEIQHFTSHRELSLSLYPSDVPLGYDAAQYIEMCRQHAPRADRYRRNKEARGFGPGGRQRQRAYYDALRDLGAPAVGLAPVIRIPALADDGTLAWAQARSRVRSLLS